MRSIASRISVMSGEGALSVFARAKELEAQGRSIIHLELGEPDFHPGKSVIDSACAKRWPRAKTAIALLSGCPPLREEIAAYLERTRNIKVSSEQHCDRSGMQNCAVSIDDGACSNRAMKCCIRIPVFQDMRRSRWAWARFRCHSRSRREIIFSLIRRRSQRRSLRAPGCC